MNKLDQNSVIGITALLVHAAKIDEIYTESEKKIITERNVISFKPSKNLKNYINNV